MLRLLLLTLTLCGCTAPPAAPDTATPAPIGAVDTAASEDTEPCVVDADTAAPDTDTAAPDTAAPDTADTGPHLPIVVYAVRHAEKGSGSDPGLTEEGKARALALVDVMKDVPLAAVYATDLVRTQQTVEPTAIDHGLPVLIDYDPEDELAEHILATHEGETVLHAGHSYTLADFMEALGVADPPGVDGYGELWIITIADGVVTVEESCFGKKDA